MDLLFIILSASNKRELPVMKELIFLCIFLEYIN